MTRELFPKASSVARILAEMRRPSRIMYLTGPFSCKRYKHKYPLNSLFSMAKSSLWTPLSSAFQLLPTGLSLSFPLLPFPLFLPTLSLFLPLTLSPYFPYSLFFTLFLSLPSQFLSPHLSPNPLPPFSLSLLSLASSLNSPSLYLST